MDRKVGWSIWCSNGLRVVGSGIVIMDAVDVEVGFRWKVDNRRSRFNCNWSGQLMLWYSTSCVQIGSMCSTGESGLGTWSKSVWLVCGWGDSWR